MSSTVTREFAPADRYLYDFGACHFKHGWAQLDTNQDASYYGNWINPLTLTLFAYCEGDTTHTQCDTEADFVAEVRRAMERHREHQHAPVIDGMCNEAIIDAFKRMGLAEYLD